MPEANTAKDEIIVGVISDTHGLMRPEALRALRDSDLIIHAGDVGKPGVLESLRSIAPVFAVRGNIDRGAWASSLPLFEVVDVGDVILYVVPDVKDLDLDPSAAGFLAVISGHSHMPVIYTKNNVFFLNPGSAGPRRFNLPVTIAFIRVRGIHLSSRIHYLETWDP